MSDMQYVLVVVGIIAFGIWMLHIYNRPHPDDPTNPFNELDQETEIPPPLIVPPQTIKPEEKNWREIVKCSEEKWLVVEFLEEDGTITRKLTVEEIVERLNSLGLEYLSEHNVVYAFSETTFYMANKGYSSDNCVMDWVFHNASNGVKSVYQEREITDLEYLIDCLDLWIRPLTTEKVIRFNNKLYYLDPTKSNYRQVIAQLCADNGRRWSDKISSHVYLNRKRKKKWKLN